LGAVSGEAPKETYETLRVAGQDKRYLVGSPEYKEALEVGGSCCWGCFWGCAKRRHMKLFVLLDKISAILLVRQNIKKLWRLGGVVVGAVSGEAPKDQTYETLRVAGQDKRYLVGSPEYKEALRLGGVVVGAVSGDAPKEAYETLRVAGQDKRYRVGSPEYEEALRLGGVVVGAVSGDAPKEDI
jgi:hypothetical protein